MNIFSEIKTKVVLLEVVGEYTTLRRSGQHFKGLCPFHVERTPSFFVTPHKSIFYCFSCQAGGDVIAFVAQMERCAPLEAARYIAQRYGIQIVETPGLSACEQQPSEWNAQQRHSALCELIARFCHTHLQEPASGEAHEYLRRRGIENRMIEQFQLGYFSAGERTRKRLLALLQRDNFIADDLVNTKFMMLNRQGLYSPFEERIIFPIHDHMGRVTGFGGRTFRATDDRPKYYNSHDSKYFNKGTLLFGLNNAKRAMQKEDSVYVAEGYMDCIALAQADLANSVATLGTACTSEHVKLLARYVNKIEVAYDGDSAGLEATMRLSEICWQHEVDVYVTELPTGEDPASYLAKPESVWSCLPRRDLFSFYVHTFQHQFSGQQPLAEKLQAVRAILQRIQRIEDPLKRTIVIQQVATASEIPLTILQRELQPLAVRPSQSVAVAQPKTQKEINRFAKALFCAILSEKYLVLPSDEYMILQVLPLRLRLLFEKLQVYRKAAAESYLFSDFFSTLTGKEQEYVAHILVAHEAQEAPDLEGLLAQCRTRMWKNTVRELQYRIEEAQRCNDHTQLAVLIQEFHQLKGSIFHKGTL